MLRFVSASLLLVAAVAAMSVVSQEEKALTSPLEKSYLAQRSSEFPTKYCRKEDVDYKVMKFYLYTRATEKPVELLVDDHGISIKNSTYNVRKNTKFIVHGWLQSRVEYEDMVRDLLYQTYNGMSSDVIVMDWSEYAKKCNYSSTNSVVVPTAGRTLSYLMKLLVTYGAQAEYNFHAVGLGVGAHIVGIAGKHLSPIRIARITALDPIGYDIDLPGKLKLQNSDALFIDVIHTSQPYVGTSRVIGHLSFYPNNGVTPQPGCSRDESGQICSLKRAVDYYHESINRPLAFYAVRCNSWLQFESGKCPEISGSVPATTMGEYVNMIAPPGLYYLKTDSSYPYGYEEPQAIPVKN